MSVVTELAEQTRLNEHLLSEARRSAISMKQLMSEKDNVRLERDQALSWISTVCNKLLKVGPAWRDESSSRPNSRTLAMYQLTEILDELKRHRETRGCP